MAGGMPGQAGGVPGQACGGVAGVGGARTFSRGVAGAGLEGGSELGFEVTLSGWTTGTEHTLGGQ
jgi:hypothetical protein